MANYDSERGMVFMDIIKKGSKVIYLGKEYVVEDVEQKGNTIRYKLYRLGKMYDTYGTTQQEKEEAMGDFTEVEVTENNKDIIKPI